MQQTTYLTRQDGSAIDRLLASRFASGVASTTATGSNQTATPTRTASTKGAEASSPEPVAQNAQPPPSVLRQAVPLH